MNKCVAQPICRRTFLKGTAILAGSTMILINLIGTASAAKATQESVQYQDSPKGDQKCSNCLQYKPGEDSGTGTCKVVEGDISAQGWCAVWVAKP